MVTDVNITNINQQSLQQLGKVFAQAAGGGSAAAGTSSAAQQQAQQTQAMQGNIRAVKESSKVYEKSKDWLKRFGQGLEEAINQTTNILGGTLMQGVLKEFRSGVQAGAEAVDGFGGYLERQRQAYYELGITVEELHNFNKTARAASINLGGFDEWSGKLAERQSHYFARLGDLTAATEHQAVMMEELTHAGAQAADLYGPFGKQLDNINDDLLKLGITYEESRELFQDFTKDEDVRHRLRGAVDKEQRKQILLEIQGRIRHFKMLGMTTEQAKKASQALEQLGGKKPLDRFKQAAKAQAALSAMGIEGASEIGNIIRKGNRATEEERERMQEVFGEAQDIAAEAAQGPMAQEFFVRGLIEKTGLEDMMGKGGVFSTKLDEGAEVNKEQLAAMKVLGHHTPILTKSAEGIDKVYNALMNNPWLTGSFQMLGNIKDLIKTFPVWLGPLAIFGTALFGIYETAKAILTGTSDIWDWLNNFFPNFASAISDAVGGTINTLLAGLKNVPFMGDIAAAAQAELDLAQEQKARDLTAAREREAQSRKQDKLMEKQITSADAMNDLTNTLKDVKMPSGGMSGGFFGPGGNNTDIMEQLEKTNSLLAKIAGLNEDQLSTMGIESAPLSVQ